MGLDMYLNRRTYVKNWDHMSDAEKHQITVKLNKKKHPYIKPKNISYITEEVGYWRKANHIHKWFVENVQNGVDECQESFPSFEQLKELLDLCEQVKKDPEKAGELLPTQSGFFFGGTEYDEWYMNDIDNTIKILKPLIKDAENKTEGIRWSPEFIYQSSW